MSQVQFGGFYGPPWPYGLYKRFNSTLFDDSEDISDFEYHDENYDDDDDDDKYSHRNEVKIKNQETKGRQQKDPISSSSSSKRQRIFDVKVIKEEGAEERVEHGPEEMNASPEKLGGASIDLDETDDGVEYVDARPRQASLPPAIEVYEIFSDNDDDNDDNNSEIMVLSRSIEEDDAKSNLISTSRGSFFQTNTEKSSSAQATVNSFLMGHSASSSNKSKPVHAQSTHHQLKSSLFSHTTKPNVPSTSHLNKTSGSGKEEWVSRFSCSSGQGASAREGPKKVRQSTLDGTFLKE